MKWIVFWIAVSVFNVPCDFPAPTEDEYGFKSDMSMVPAIACFKKSEKQMYKIFDDPVAAEAFFDNANKCGEIVFSHCVKDMVIKELHPYLK